MSRLQQVATLVGFVIIVVCTGEVGRHSVDWFWPHETWSKALVRPSFAIPDEIDFQVLWLIAYFLIAYAGWRVAMRRKFTKLRISAYTCLLVFNCVRVPVFYGWRQMFVALLVMLVLLVATVMTVLMFVQVERVSGFVIVPYLVWCLYEVCVVAAYWWHNYETEGFYNYNV